MALEKPPQVTNAELEAAKTYRPEPDTIMGWHTVTNNMESWLTIAAENGVPVDKLIACNFPGAVVKGKIVPEIVNWYLGHHSAFKCPQTHDRKNRRFKGGERIAIPMLGRMEIGEPEIILKPKKPVPLDPKPGDHSDIIPGQKFAFEISIPPKGEFVANYFLWKAKISGDGEILSESAVKTQYKKGAVKVAVEAKLQDDLKGALAVRFEEKVSRRHHQGDQEPLEG